MKFTCMLSKQFVLQVLSCLEVFLYPFRYRFHILLGTLPRVFGQPTDLPNTSLVMDREMPSQWGVIRLYDPEKLRGP